MGISIKQLKAERSSNSDIHKVQPAHVGLELSSKELKYFAYLAKDTKQNTQLEGWTLKGVDGVKPIIQIRNEGDSKVVVYVYPVTTPVISTVSSLLKGSGPISVRGGLPC